MATPNTASYWRDQALALQEQVRILSAKLEVERARVADADLTLVRMRAPMVPSELGPDAIVQAAAMACNTTPEAVMGDLRTRDAGHARLISYRLLRDALNLGPVEIARHFGRDHSTIIKGIDRAVRYARDNAEFRERLQRVRWAIKAARQEATP